MLKVNKEKAAIQIITLDASRIDEIMEVENLSFTVPWSKNALVEELTRNMFAAYIGAVVDGKIVGYAGMWKVIDEGHITNIAVHPSYRCMGIGSQLIGGLIKIACKEHLVLLTLEVRQSNAAARSLYSKFGFTVEGIRKQYYADNNEDALIMSMQI